MAHSPVKFNCCAENFLNNGNDFGFASHKVPQGYQEQNAILRLFDAFDGHKKRKKGRNMLRLTMLRYVAWACFDRLGGADANAFFNTNTA